MSTAVSPTSLPVWATNSRGGTRARPRFAATTTPTGPQCIEPGSSNDRTPLRRCRGGWRPQRPRVCRLPRGRRHVGLRPRTSGGGGGRRRDRGISPGLSQFHRELHGQPARSPGDPGNEARPSWTRHPRAAHREFPAAARRPVAQGGRWPRGDAGGGGQVLPLPMPTPCPPTTRCSSGWPRCCATCSGPRRPTSGPARWRISPRCSTC